MGSRHRKLRMRGVRINSVMRDKIEMEEVFTENWEQLIDEILEEGLDLIWNERVEKYEKKRLFKLDFSPKI